jgi:hypothetical protein
MSNDLQQLTERIRQVRAAMREQLRIASIGIDAVAGRAVAGLTPGDRVFDTVTGQTGVVIHGTRENVVVPATGRQNG